MSKRSTSRPDDKLPEGFGEYWPRRPVRLISVDTACDRLGIGRTKFYELAKKGEIKLKKIGRRSLVGSDEVDAYADAL